MGHLVHPVVTAQDIWDKSVDVSLTVYWNELGTGQADNLEELNLRNSQALRRFTVGGISLYREAHG